VTLEVLNFSFVLFSLRARRERAEVATLSCFRLNLSRVQAILPGFEFPYHGCSAIFLSGKQRRRLALNGSRYAIEMPWRRIQARAASVGQVLTSLYRRGTSGIPLQ